MLVTTTNNIEGKKITVYLGLVSGEAILGANIGVTPSNDGNLIRVPFPALTEEKRKEQVKELKKFGEDAKIAIRNARKAQNDAVKKSEKFSIGFGVFHAISFLRT